MQQTDPPRARPAHTSRPVRLGSYVLGGILAVIPFHAFLTVWLSQTSGHYDLIRLWKEVLLVLLVPLAAYVLWRRPRLWCMLDTRWLFWASLCYGLLQLGLGGLAYAKGQVNAVALAYGLIVDLRPLVIFWLCLIFAAQSDWLRRRWALLVLVPAAVVVAFGLAQIILPADSLKHFGYGRDTIPAYGTVDQKAAYVRVQSTLRGANPLGAYLVIILAALAVLTVRPNRPRIGRRWYVAAAGAAGTVLLLTYSRSAYFGAAIAVGLALWWSLSGRVMARRWLLIGLAGLMIAAGGALALLRTNDRFQNTFFHTDEHSTALESSNDSRAQALGRAAGEVLRKPFGRGPGTAGPASAHNSRPARIAENYYLQIGQETGWPGLALFLLLNGLVAVKLWRLRQERLPRLLLASLAGLTFINLVSHAWTDDTLGLLWWGLAGIALAPAILPVASSTKNQHAHKPLQPV